ncbi:uncharacterized protein LOC125827018 [Solanum verrucosum]|uniref:uncharacterized protein LOC125827018 n=1 Tax=Solanum verrucosum TaxID=315347 RepID=UPI0020D0CF0F|nr:uncharacterized protein LOC125827018 [Solanum verrucosum]
MLIKRNKFRMHQKAVQQILLVLYFLLSYNRVQGEKIMSKSEDVELEKQLKFLNKPAVKTVKTKYGDVYDCIDFYKQPAFDHPLLKDHNFHPKMKPTLSRIKKNSSDSTTTWSSMIWSKDERCPFGTVPIKRITKDDLLRQKYMPPPEDAIFDVSNNSSEPKGGYISSQGYQVAIARTLTNPNNKFTGAGMITNFYNPRVEDGQHSACRLKIQKDSDIIQVGWRVDPTLYGDSKTRLFIHSQFGKTDCFNTLCPGFVHVDTGTPLDMSYMDSLTHRGVDGYEETMYIERDSVNGNWWLLLSSNYAQIGFWPQRIFTGLTSFATNVEWGGVVYSPPGVPKPPMGSSFFPIRNNLCDAFCRSITVLNKNGKTIQVDKVTTQVDNPNVYKVLFERLGNDKESYLFFLYGGPGESAQV